MRQTRETNQILYGVKKVIFFLLFAAGCTQAEVEDTNTQNTAGAGNIETTFHFEVSDSQAPVTRSITFTAQGSTETDTLSVGEATSVADTLQTRSATELPDEQEKKVANLWIGQYNAAGTTLLSHQYIESVTGTQVTAKLVATTGNCHVRFVANAGDLGKITTETLLDKKTLTYTSTEDGRPSSNLFAMTGEWIGNINENTTSLPFPSGTTTVKLTRLATKITFTYKINGEGFTFTPTSVTLKNAPNQSQIGELENQLSSNIAYNNYTGTISKTGATIYWYLPENMAGTGSPSVSTEKEKKGDGVTNATCIELFGDAIQNGVPYTDVAFRFYPGKDENNYNIKRNDHFIMSIDLKGLDISDKRITIGNVPAITAPTGNLPAVGGSKEVHITSRAGVVWSLPIPDWLSATMNGQITPGGSTLTNQGPGKVTFTAGMNQTAEVRSQTYDIKLDDDKSQSFTIAQDPSTLNINGATSITIGPEANNNLSTTFTATPGLNWTAGITGDTWLSFANATGGTTPSGPVTVPYRATLNTMSSPRYGSITFRAGDPGTGPVQTINVTQNASWFNLSSARLELDYLPTSGSVRVNGTPGLVWTLTPFAQTNNITPLTSGGTSDGTDQEIRFQVPNNGGRARSATFTVNVSGGDHTKELVVRQANNPMATIDDALLKDYYNTIKRNNTGYDWYWFPPFDADGVDQKYQHPGISNVVLSNTPSMKGSYTIQIQRVQKRGTITYSEAQNYCKDLVEQGRSGWRLPTFIELFAIWNKTKGTNMNAFDDEDASWACGEKLDLGWEWFWSSSVHNRIANQRCTFSFSRGIIYYNNLDTYAIRCVRDVQ